MYFRSPFCSTGRYATTFAMGAPMPPMPCNRALYDCSFLAWLVTMKFALLVPLDRVRLHLKAQGIDLAMGTLVHLIARAATLADPVDGGLVGVAKALPGGAAAPNEVTGFLDRAQIGVSENHGGGS